MGELRVSNRPSKEKYEGAQDANVYQAFGFAPTSEVAHCQRSVLDLEKCGE